MVAILRNPGKRPLNETETTPATGKGGSRKKTAPRVGAPTVKAPPKNKGRCQFGANCFERQRFTSLSHHFAT